MDRDDSEFWFASFVGQDFTHSWPISMSFYSGEFGHLQRDYHDDDAFTWNSNRSPAFDTLRQRDFHLIFLFYFIYFFVVGLWLGRFRWIPTPIAPTVVFPSVWLFFFRGNPVKRVAPFSSSSLVVLLLYSSFFFIGSLVKFFPTPLARLFFY